jgi:OOP family OmpA-OmpF porin
MKNTLKIASLLCFLPMTQNSIAHPSHTHSDGYVYDTRAVVVRDGFGNCVRTTRWSAENAIAECDPDLFKQAAAPVTAAPPPAKPAVERAVKAAPTAPVSAKLAPMSMSLNAEESFDSNKAELKPAAKHRLSEFVQQVNAFAYGQLTIVGHADRTGSNMLNQTLSERRANTVYNYLVSVGISGDKIASNGAGSSQPITQKSDCAKLKSKKLQACLAPDRRVEITVTDIHTK